MRKAAVAVALSVLVALVSANVDTVTHAQGDLVAPSNVRAENTGNLGEVRISWDAVPGAAYYRIGWVAYSDVEPIIASGGDWLERFAFIDIQNRGQTQHIITRLTPGVQYAFIVASNDDRYGTPRWPLATGWRFLTLSDAPTSQASIGSASVDVTWDAVSGAAYYRIGWVVYSDVEPIIASGGDWLEHFAFIDIANRGQTEHTITRLTPGLQYAFIVAGNAGRYGTPQWPPASGWQFMTPDAVTLEIAPPEEIGPFIVNIPSAIYPVVSYTGEGRLSFVLTQGAPGMQLNPADGIIVWTPQEADLGRQFDVAITVTDGVRSARTSFQVSVTTFAPLATQVQGAALVVTDPDSSLNGLQVAAWPAAPPFTSSQLAELQSLLRSLSVETAPPIPAEVTSISDALVVAGTFAEPVEIRYPIAVEQLPEGLLFDDINYYHHIPSQGGATSEGHWAPLAVERSFVGTADEPVYVFTLYGLGGFGFFGYERTDHPQAAAVVAGHGSAPATAPVAGSTRQPFSFERRAPQDARASLVTSAQTENECRLGEPMESLGVKVPTVDCIVCTPGTHWLSSRVNYNDIHCEYKLDPEVKINITQWLNRCDDETAPSDCLDPGFHYNWNTASQQLAQYMISAQLGLRNLELPHSKSMKLTFGTGNVVYPITGLWVIQIDDRYVNPSQGAEHVIYHEMFHHAQLRYYTPNPLSHILFLNNVVAPRHKWLTESLAEWFKDELNDDLSQYLEDWENLRHRFPDILKTGLAHPGDKQYADYIRWPFIKMMAGACPSFRSNVGRLFYYNAPPLVGLPNPFGLAPTGKPALADFMSRAGCHFGNHLDGSTGGTGHTLASSLVFYNYATLFKRDIALLDANETRPPMVKFARLDEYSVTDLTTKPGTLYVPDVGARSFIIDIDADNMELNPGDAVQLVVESDGPIVVSMVSESGGFQATNTIGRSSDPDDQDPHLWFAVDGTAERTVYIHPNGNTAPQLFTTLVNSDLSDSVAVSVSLRVVANDAQWGRLEVDPPALSHEGGDVTVRVYTREPSDPDHTATAPTIYALIPSEIAIPGAANRLEGDVQPCRRAAMSGQNYTEYCWQTTFSGVPANVTSGALVYEVGVESDRITGTAPTGSFSVSGRSPFSNDRPALKAFYDSTRGHHWKSQRNWLTLPDIGEWHGVTVNADERVTRLVLMGNDLSGELPDEVGYLEYLEVLDLAANRRGAWDGVGGRIPRTLGQLARLTRLDLSVNDLERRIPSELGNLQSLERLDLSNNRLSGEIPIALSNLQSLERLDLSDNQLSGAIPAELALLTNLTRLSLAGNQFTGCIPASLRNVSENDLDELDLPSCEAEAAQSDLAPLLHIAALDFDDLGAAGNHDPSGIWSDGTTMWVADASDDKLYAYQMATKARVASRDFDTLDAADNTNLRGIWSDGTTMWVADSSDDKLYAYQVATKARVASRDFNTLEAAGNANPRGIWSDGTTMWVVDSSDDKLYAYQMATKARVASRDFNTLRAAGNTSPWGIWSDGTTMWVADSSDDKLYAYDLHTTLRVPARDYNILRAAGNVSAEGIWSDGVTMWVADGATHKIYAYGLEPPPGKPTGLTATLGAQDGAVVLNWTPGANATRHQVVLKGANDTDGRYWPEVLAGDATTATITGLEVGQTYRFWVRAGKEGADGSILWSEWSNWTEAMPGGERTTTVGQVSSNPISGGRWHTCGLRADGTAVCWGANLDGQATPPAGVAFAAISSGGRHTCGLRVDGAPVCWGWDEHGQATPPPGQTFTAISSGLRHTCGLRADGAAVCWGLNLNGQATPPAGQSFAAISSGRWHTCGLRSNGTVVCWGANRDGQSTPPTGETFAIIGSGGDRTCGLRANGTAVCWGDDRHDQSTPPAGETLSAISGGGEHTCGLRSNGAAVCWGDNRHGQSTPPFGEAYATIASGESHTCGLRVDGTAVCWGLNLDGQATPPAGEVFALAGVSGLAPSPSGEPFSRNPAQDFDGLIGNPWGIWSDGTTMLVSDEFGGKVYAYDMDTKTRVPARDLHELGISSLLDIWSDGSTLWLTRFRHDSIYAYDLATQERVPGQDFNALGAAGNHIPTGIWSDGETMWVADSTDDKIYAYDMVTKARIISQEFNVLGSSRQHLP